MSLTITELRARVHAALVGDEFHLQTSTLESSTIDLIVADFLPDGRFALARAVAEDGPDGTTVHVRGTGVDLPFQGMMVEIDFYLDGTEAAFTLQAAAGMGWSVTKAFPVMARTLAEAFSFTDSPSPILRLRSHPQDDQTVGMSFQGILNLDTMTGGLADLTGRSQQALSGLIELKEHATQLTKIEWTAPVSEQVDLGLVTVEALTFTIGGYLTYNFIDDVYSTIPYVRLGAAFPFQAQGVQHHLPVAVDIFDLGRAFRFSIDLNEAIDAALHEISSLTDGLELEGFLPDDFHLEDLIKLTAFYFDFDTSLPRKINTIAVDLQSTRLWTIFRLDRSQTDLQVENIVLSFRLFDPFGARTGWLGLSGELVLGDAGRVVIGANYPNFSIHGGMKDGTTLHLDELLRLILGSGVQVPALEMKNLAFRLDAGEYRFESELDGLWSIDNVLAIDQVELGLEHRNNQTQVQLRGQFQLAGVDLFIAAAYTGGEGWLFEGGTHPNQDVSIGTLITDLARFFGSTTLPPALTGLTLQNISVSFNTQTKDFTFTCETRFPLGDDELDLAIHIDIKHQGSETFTKTFTGKLTVDGRVFDVVFAADGSATMFLAAYHKDNGDTIDIKDLMATVSRDVANALPSGLSITLNDALLAYRKTGTAKFLFGLEMGAGINLSNLPLVGRVFPPEETIKLIFQLLVASAALPGPEVTAINGLIPNGVTKLPTGALGAGLTLSTPMQFGNTNAELSLPVQVADTASNPSQPLEATGQNTDVKWFTLQKTFGPVHFNRVGAAYRDGELWFLLDASFATAGLTLSLDGLAVSSPLNAFSPQFHLEGLGIDYQNGPLEIGGAFLRTTITPEQGEPYDEYDGKAVIKTSEFSLSAIGSYAYLNGHPSLFIYGVLDYPLGGPSFFFVTGLAAGFGYNRALNIPPLAQLTSFPLVAEAMGNLAPSHDEQAELRRLHDYIPASVGDYFLAVGVKFTSFKIIDSFVLLTVAFGHRFEIDVLGLSTLVVPTPDAGQAVEPLAEVQMALRATFVPDEGFLGVEARLTSASFILSRNCHLTGGFAFYSWFSGEHAGDFVQTLGGYHPQFRAPDHYPRVPRLGFNWQVSPELTVKGDAYYALTTHALMAGGHLEATWKDGSIQAWFKAGADFLISWKPYHYDIRITVDMGVSYTYHFFGTHHISVDLGAGLHIWGPDFSGQAHIKLWIVSFDVSFGADASQQPQPIAWDDPNRASFKPSFLPSDDAICGLSPQTGLIRTVEHRGQSTWVVNPKTFSLVSNSVIPIKHAWRHAQNDANVLDGRLADKDAETEFGIGSMAVASTDLDTRLTITIHRIDVRFIALMKQLAYRPRLRRISSLSRFTKTYRPVCGARP